jgi:hypothetical protein
MPPVTRHISVTIAESAMLRFRVAKRRAAVVRSAWLEVATVWAI